MSNKIKKDSIFKKVENKIKSDKIVKSSGISSDDKPVQVKQSAFSILEVVTIVIITSFISLLMGLVISNSNVKNSNYKALSTEMQNFLEDYSEITGNYYEDINEKELLDGALENIISKLGDPYSEVVDSSLANSLATRLQGTYSGFGIEVANNKDNDIYIVNVIDDSPASKVGLKSNDKIIAMDGVSLINTSTTDFVSMVRKSTVSTNKLTIIRAAEQLDIEITREKVTLKSVSSTTYLSNDKKVGYIYISLFASNTDQQFKEELAKLEKDKIDSLIIDLRDNTGGHLLAVENIMSLFFDKTHVIYQIEEKDGSISKKYSSGTKNKKYPIAVLVNKNSASASEMLTAALKEEYGAKVIGLNTYGKGTVQEVQTTKSGVQYKLTTQKWLTPKGNWINEVGIKPNIKVELSEEYFMSPTVENDNQLQVAIDNLTK